jgi:hypothetical protein
MKTFLILITLIIMSYSNSLDSIIKNPYDIDFTKKIDITELIAEIGVPEDKDSISSIDDNMKVSYPKFNCYLALDNNGDTFLYTIEIKRGDIKGIEIGMSKREFIKKFGKPVIIDSFKRKDVLQYRYSENGIEYLLCLTFKNNKLNNFFINQDII